MNDDKQPSEWLTVRRKEWGALLARITELERLLTLAQSVDETRRQQLETVYRELEEMRRSTYGH